MQSSPRYQLTNFFICSHAVLFLIPWTPVPYKPAWLGPIDLWIFLFLCLSMAFCIEVLHYGTIKKVPFCIVLVLSWFVLINALGILSGVLKVNPVRSHIPLTIQVARMIPYADGFLIYYLVIRNNWSLKEFEKFLRIVLIPGIIMSIECLLVFYMRLPLGINQFSLWDKGEVHWFVSMFARHTTHPGPIGILTVWISFYFWTRYKKKRYLIYSLLGSLLVFANVTLSAYLGLFAGIIFVSIFYLRLPVIKRSTAMLRSSIITLGPLIMTVALVVIIYLGNVWRPKLTDLNNMEERVMRRAYQICRAADVLASYPFLGAGPGIGFYYAFSKHTPPIVTGRMSDIFPPRPPGIDWFIEDPYHGYHQSIHNVFANFIIDLGLLGLFLLFYMLYKGIVIICCLFSNAKKKEYDRSMLFSFATLLALILSLSIYCSAKPKFYPYWLFVIILSFASYLYKNMFQKSKMVEDHIDYVPMCT